MQKNLNTLNRPATAVVYEEENDAVLATVLSTVTTAAKPVLLFIDYFNRI